MSSRSPLLDKLFEEQTVQDPYGYLGDLRKNDPVHEIPGTGCYLITSMELIRSVVARTDEFSSVNAHFLHVDASNQPTLRSVGGAEMEEAAYAAGVLATVDGADHRRQRRVVNRKFTTEQMDAFERQFEELADEAFDAELAGGSIDWVSAVADPLPNVILARILGFADETAPLLRRAGFGSVERINGFISPERDAELDQDFAMGGALTFTEFSKAKESPELYGDSLLGLLAVAVADGEISDLEAMAIMGLMISAGGESTASLTGNAAHLLAVNPMVQEQLRDDPNLIATFVEEALRLEPSFRGHYRVVTRDTVIGDTPVRAGSRLVLSWPAGNHDPSFYTHPDEIDLDRENPRNHVGFGWGLHLCVGAPLARVEARAAIRTLLRKTKSFSTPSDWTPRYHKSLMIRRLVDLPLLVTLAP